MEEKSFESIGDRREKKNWQIMFSMQKELKIFAFFLRLQNNRHPTHSTKTEKHHK